MKLKSIYREGSSFRPFLISIVCMGLAYGLYKGIQDNYLAEVVAMGEVERGVAEVFRELPGLLLVFILAALYMFSAESIFKIGAVIMVIGMGMLALVKPTVVLATLGICIFSLGEHIQLGMKNAMSLEYAKPKMGGQALGIQNSANQAGTLVGFLIVLLVFSIIASNVENFKLFFLISAGIMVIGTVCSFRIKGKTAQDPLKTRFYFNKKYTKYYFLEVFYGARKQVFFTFGPYVLILFYGAKTATISLLFAISAICGFFLAPVVGKIIDKIGYKIVMVSDTLILVVVCFFYGFAHHFFPMNVAFIVCCVNYVLDSIISLASMAANVYVQDISDSPEETRATISTGISVNHLITILIALFGGWIWKTLGIETLFILSAVLGLCNSAYAATIRVKKK